MTQATQWLERLCRISAAQSADHGWVWPETLGPDDWCMSPELLSVYGTEIYESLDERERRRLSFFEAVNFFSLNIWGERQLIAGIAPRLYAKDCDAISRYLQHFLAEENRHMAMFAEFCGRYAGKVYRQKTWHLSRAHAEGEEEFLFFARVLLFEEIVDRYNVAMAGDSRLPPIVRHINRTHHRDESRHLAFGRRRVVELFERCAPKWSSEVLTTVRAELEAFLAASWREYYNPEAYADAGVPDAYGCRQRLLAHPARQRHHAAFAADSIAYLRRHGILSVEVAL
jgi:hypothetical protein